MNVNQAYQILEVQHGASEQQIKDNYKRLAKKYHPDINKSSEAESKFKDINTAYSVLTGKTQPKHNSFNVWEEFVNANSFEGGFFNIKFDFGNGGGQNYTNVWGQSNIRKRTPQNGTDFQTNLILTIEDIFSDIEKVLKFRIYVHCAKCAGTGSLDKNINNVVTCNSCNGLGSVARVFGQSMVQTLCDNCVGYGNVFRNRCNSCQNGLVAVEETLKLKINKGDYFKKNRQIIGGYGNAGMFGGRRGNFIVNLILDNTTVNSFDFNRIQLKEK